MSLEPPSAARICVLADPPGLLVRAGRFQGRFSLPGLYAPELADLKARLPDLLHNFRRAVGIQGVALGALAQRALDELDSWAAGLAARLLGGPVTKEFDVDQLETAIAKLLYPALHGGGDDVPVIVLETEAGGVGEDATWLLPIEFLRIAEPRRQRPRPDDVLRRILGFHAVVVRRGRVPTGPGFLGVGPIPVSALIYETTGDRADLQGPEMQASFFEHNSSTFRIQRWPRGAKFNQDILRDTSWPTYNEKNVADGLVQQVFMAAGLDSKHSEPYTGAIVHIACHYYTKQVSQITQPAPFLSFDRLSTNVGIDALYDAFANRMGIVIDGASIARTAAQRFGQMIVFLNACETATSADHGVSLLDKLFELGFRHIVASETLVPDPLAAVFATQLYLGMMRGLPLGGALLQARSELLERYENPGGLLYTIYGDPWLKFNTKRGDTAT